MSTSNFGGAQGLTQDEQILHHHAAMIKKDLDAYHAESGRKKHWKGIFKHHLAKSMRYYIKARERNQDNPIRVHPLLISLSKTIDASETNPDIGAISEHDERALKSQYYTSPSQLPPLELHYPGKNAGCRECTASAPQDGSGGEGNAAQCNSAAIPHAPEDNITHIGSASFSTCNRGKKRRRASSGVRGNLSNPRSPKAAALIHRNKGKGAQKAGSRDVNTSSPEETSEAPSQEGRDRGVEPGADGDLTLVEDLKNEVQVLKGRCNMLEKSVKDLQSICNTHQSTLETWRKHIVDLQNRVGAFDPSYRGVQFEVAP